MQLGRVIIEFLFSASVRLTFSSTILLINIFAQLLQMSALTSTLVMKSFWQYGVNRFSLQLVILQSLNIEPTQLWGLDGVMEPQEEVIRMRHRRKDEMRVVIDL